MLDKSKGIFVNFAFLLSENIFSYGMQNLFSSQLPEQGFCLLSRSVSYVYCIYSFPMTSLGKWNFHVCMSSLKVWWKGFFFFWKFFLSLFFFFVILLLLFCHEWRNLKLFFGGFFLSFNFHFFIFYFLKWKLITPFLLFKRWLITLFNQKGKTK